LGTEAQSTSGLLSSSRWCSGSASIGWKRTVDVVGEETVASIVGSSLGELYGTDPVSDSGKLARHSSEGFLFLLSWHAIEVYSVSVRIGGSVNQSTSLINSQDSILPQDGALNIGSDSLVCNYFSFMSVR